MADTIEDAYRRGYHDDALSAVRTKPHVPPPYSILDEEELFYAWMVGAEDAWLHGHEGDRLSEPFVPADLRQRIAAHMRNEIPGASLH